MNKIMSELKERIARAITDEFNEKKFKYDPDADAHFFKEEAQAAMNEIADWLESGEPLFAVNLTKTETQNQLMRLIAKQLRGK